MGDGGHSEMDSWIQLLIYSIVSLGFVTSLQSFYVTGRPRKQFELPFQQRIESCLLKRSVKKILYGFSCYICYISRYISLKGMIYRIYFSKKTPWHSWNVKAFFKQNICRKRHEQSQLRFDRNGPIRTITNIKNLTREIIVSETSQTLQIFAAQEQKCRERLHVFSRIEGNWKITRINDNCNVLFNTVHKFAYFWREILYSLLVFFCGLVALTLCFFSNQSKTKLKPLTSNQNSVILFCFIVA